MCKPTHHEDAALRMLDGCPDAATAVRALAWAVRENYGFAGSDVERVLAKAAEDVADLEQTPLAPAGLANFR